MDVSEVKMTLLALLDDNEEDEEEFEEDDLMEIDEN